jgi:CoA:oxalate CoA-transferase
MGGYPLQGLRVLDLSRVLAGPYVGRMLSDLGAEVVKVEPPEGDITRLWGKQIAGLSGYFTQQNVGKQNISIDLRRAGAAELVRRLVERADVLVENFRPGVMAQYGLAYTDLSPRNRRLVMLSISGYGQVGPDQDKPAFAPVVHAEAGIMHRVGLALRGAPRDVPMSVADMNAGLHGLAGVLAALYQRERTGEGQHVDIAMLDSMLACDDHLHLALDAESIERPFASEIWPVPFGHIVMSGDFRWIFRRLCERCELQDPTPPGSDLAEKIAARRGAVAEFLGRFADPAALAPVLELAEIPWGLVRTSAQAITSPTVVARKSVVDMDDRAGGTRRVIQSPYRFSAAQSGMRGPAAFRGEHNRAVLQAWLTCSDGEVDALNDARVLLQDLPRAP